MNNIFPKLPNICLPDKIKSPKGLDRKDAYLKIINLIYIVFEYIV